VSHAVSHIMDGEEVLSLFGSLPVTQEVPQWDADPTVASAATGHVDASREIEPLAITYTARSATDM